MIGLLLASLLVAGFVTSEHGLAAAAPRNGLRAGLPDSPAFGFGLHIDPWGPEPLNALDTADTMNVDWIAVDLDWAAAWPGVDAAANFQPLEAFLRQAELYQLPVLLRIQNAPAWALSAAGPDPVMVNMLLRGMVHPFPAVEAVELFPRANTRAGWGAAPDPQAYAALLQQARTELNQSGRDIALLVGGLAAESPLPDATDILATDFLQALYDLDMRAYLAIVGLDMAQTSGGLLDEPVAGAAAFRVYEHLRRVMRANDHIEGLIWITAFGWPVELQNSRSDKEQADWLQMAYAQLNAQLYLGAAFFRDINQPASMAQGSGLLLAGGLPHPALDRLGEIIQARNVKPDPEPQVNTPARSYHKMQSQLKLAPKQPAGN